MILAFNNGFPVSYPYYTPVAPVQVQQPQSYTNPVQGGKIWVQGENGAKSYLVAPNSSVDLWDSEQQTIYIKSADATGMPSIKILDYTVRDSGSGPAPVAKASYATKEEMTAVTEQMAALKTKVEKLIRKAREEEDDE